MSPATKTRSGVHGAVRAAARRKARARRQPPSPFTLAFGVVSVLAGVATVVAVLSGPDGDVGPQTAAVSIVGEPLASADRLPDPAVGTPIPEVRGVDFAGEPVGLEPDGRPLAIVFLAHACPHCQRQVRDLAAWVEREGAPEGIDVIAVSTLADPAKPNYPPETWLERERWPFPVLVDDARSSVAAAYGLEGTPMWVFADAHGVVQGRLSGARGVDELSTVFARLRRGPQA